LQFFIIFVKGRVEVEMKLRLPLSTDQFLHLSLSRRVIHEDNERSCETNLKRNDQKTRKISFAFQTKGSTTEAADGAEISSLRDCHGPVASSQSSERAYAVLDGADKLLNLQFKSYYRGHNDFPAIV